MLSTLLGEGQEFLGEGSHLSLGNAKSYLGRALNSP